MFELIVIFYYLILISVLIASIVGWCFLCKRLGYEPMLGLAMLIPLVNLIVFFWLAFSKSPIEKKIESMKRQQLRNNKNVGKPDLDHSGEISQMPNIVVDPEGKTN